MLTPSRSILQKLYNRLSNEADSPIGFAKEVCLSCPARATLAFKLIGERLLFHGLQLRGRGPRRQLRSARKVNAIFFDLLRISTGMRPSD
jgi:hypothetical protein